MAMIWRHLKCENVCVFVLQRIECDQGREAYLVRETYSVQMFICRPYDHYTLMQFGLIFSLIQKHTINTFS